MGVVVDLVVVAVGDRALSSVECNPGRLSFSLAHASQPVSSSLVTRGNIPREWSRHLSAPYIASRPFFLFSSKLQLFTMEEGHLGQRSRGKLFIHASILIIALTSDVFVEVDDWYSPPVAILHILR